MILAILVVIAASDMLCNAFLRDALQPMTAGGPPRAKGQQLLSWTPMMVLHYMVARQRTKGKR
jgi:hypothetical protein